MLRMGKDDKTQNPVDTDYSTRSYSPYQSNETQRPATENSTTNSSKAITESESLAREIKDGSLSGFVGSGTVITGDASFKSMLRVDGRFSGRISSTSGTLIVGSGGQVDANIEVAIANIHGVVNGDIVATDRVELGRAAKLTGNIQTPSLVIEQGAVFEGGCKMTKVSAADKQTKVERKDNVLDAAKLDAAKLEPAKLEPAKLEAVKVDVAKKPEIKPLPNVTAAAS